MKSKKKAKAFMIAILAIFLMFIIEQYLKPGYLLKSSCKVVLFLGTIIFYLCENKKNLVEQLQLYKLKNANLLLVIMGIVYLLTIVLFLIFKPFLDVENIKNSLITKENITKQNCFFIFSYIILCNSFLEETFFRGFITDLFANRKVGRIASCLLFALYHIGIVNGWFNPLLLIVCILGLAIVGYVLQLIADYYHTIVASWLIHGCANLALNTIGLILLFTI